MVNFCTKNIEKLLKPLILFKEVPEVIISKWWARTYTHESPFYSVMNKTLMKSEYKEYEIYIRLLYRGLACNSYRPKYFSKLIRGTKLDLSEINYLKSISETAIIFNKSFLSFTIQKEKEKEKTESDDNFYNNEDLYSLEIAVAFQNNCSRSDSSSTKHKKSEEFCCIANPPKKSIKMKDENDESTNLNVLIEITNISENDKKII